MKKFLPKREMHVDVLVRVITTTEYIYLSLCIYRRMFTVHAYEVNYALGPLSIMIS